MSELWQRIKNWCIKKLGGYTKAEYDDWSRIPICKPPIIRVVHRTVDLRASQIIHVEDLMLHPEVAEIKARRMVLDELCEGAVQYIEWRTSEDRWDRTKTLEGRLVVVELN